MNNKFNCLSNDSDEDVSLGEQETVTAPKTAQPSASQGFKWGDYATDDDDEDVPDKKLEEEPSASTGPQQDNQTVKAEQKAWKEFDGRLHSLKKLSVSHTVKRRNKDTGELEETSYTRTFKVVTKSMYDSYKKLIAKHKTYSGDKFNKKEHLSKIKLANELMTMAYKDPDVPCCFNYPVVNIYLKNGNRITRNEILPSSTCAFDIFEIAYYPPYSS